MASPPTPTATVHLPTEIWISVFRHLQAEDDLTSLSRLSRACKLFNAIAVPPLYRTFETELDGQCVSPSLASFLRTVETNRQLAELVSEVRVDTSGDVYEDGSVQAGADLEFAFRQLNLGDLPVRDVSFEEKNAMMLELLLFLLPQLTSFSFTVGPRQHLNRYISRWRYHRFAQSFLWSLKNLTLGHNAWEGGFDLGPFKDIVAAARNLETLSINMCYSVTEQLTLGNLRELHINYSVLARSAITNLLQHTHRLESFRYVSGRRKVRPGDEVTPAEIVAALRPTRQTLKRLELDFEQSIQLIIRPHSFWGPDRPQCVDTLRDFPVLERVKLSQDAVFRPDDANPSTDGAVLSRILPPSLAMLYMLNVNANLFDDVRTFAEEAVGGGYPALRSVWLSGSSPKANFFRRHATFSEDDQEKIGRVFANTGAEFIYVNY